MNPVRSLALFGTVGSFDAQTIDEAAAIARLAGTHRQDPRDVLGALEAGEPLAIVVAAESPDARAICAEVRSRRRYAHIPIVGFSTRRSNLSFVELYQWGGDDVFILDGSAPLVRRLRPLLGSPPAVPRGSFAPLGDAIIAGGDAEWKAVVARTLGNAGMSIRFADSATEAVEQSSTARVVVAADDLVPDGAESAVARARSIGIVTPWVIVAHPKRVDALRKVVKDLARVAIVDAFAPPENVLFVANDLAREGLDQRASSRLLFGTTVTFRAGGRDDGDDEIGFTYNVSAGGVFVRTLAPFEPGDEVWLEMWAPRSPRRVRLSGTVAWRRKFGPNEGATVPPGFGVHIVDGLGDDLERWRTGCEALASNATPCALPPPVRLRPSILVRSLVDRAAV